MLKGSIACQHTPLLGANPLGFVHGLLSARASVVTFHALGDEIWTKYAPTGEMQHFSDSHMIYKIPGGAFSEIYLNTAVTARLSLTFANMVELKPLALWYSPGERTEVIKERLRAIRLEPALLSKVITLRTVEQLPNMTKDQSPYVQESFMEKNLGSSESVTLHLADMSQMYLQDPLKRIIAKRSEDQAQPIKPVPEKERDNAATRVMPPTHFWHRFQLMDVVNIVQTHSMTPMVFAQNILSRDIASRSHNDGFIPPGKSLHQGFQPDVQADINTLINISRPKTDVETEQALVSAYRSGRLQPMAEQGSIPLRHQRLTPDIADDIQQFTVIRRVERLEPPLLPYALAQQPRPTVQEAPMVAKVREQEVVSVVRQEMQAYMASGAAAKHLSRADYTRIAEHVYASLARRLLVEKERLGLR